MKNSPIFTQTRLISLSWCIWLFVVSFALLGNQCGCLKNAPIDNTPIDNTTDNTPLSLSLEFTKLSYDRGNNRLIVIIKNTGKEVAKDLSLRCTNISEDEASRAVVRFNNTPTITIIPVPDLAADSSTQEIYVTIDFQTAKKALAQMEVISGQQLAVRDSIPVNLYPIDLLPIGDTILIAKLGETREFKWRLVTDEQVDFTAISLQVDKFPGTNIDVSIAGTSIGLTQVIDVATITGADLEKLIKQEEILVKVKNNETELNLNRIGCTLLDRGKEIAKICNILVPDIQAALLPAAALGDVKLVKQAIANGVDINNVNNSQGGTALHLATERDHRSIVKILLNKGANIKAKDNDGDTALHVAASQGQQGIAKLLLAHGADKGIKNNGHETAADLAKDQELKDLINNWKN